MSHIKFALDVCVSAFLKASELQTKVFVAVDSACEGSALEVRVTAAFLSQFFLTPTTIVFFLITNNFLITDNFLFTNNKALRRKSYTDANILSDPRISGWETTKIGPPTKGECW